MNEGEESRSESESEEVHSIDENESMESVDEGHDENISYRAKDDYSNTQQEEEEEEEGEGENEDISTGNNVINKTIANPGWADAMRKVLHTKKPKRKKTIVLSKAKKLSEIVLSKETKAPEPFETEGAADRDVKKKTLDKKQDDEEEETVSKRRKRKEIKTGIRVKPSILDRERDRTIQKIATKGVVQLFNAVRRQQMEIDKKLVEAGPLERKREKVLKDIDKRAFLDVLMGGTKSIQVDDTKTETKIEASEEGKKCWKVLRDDFAMGASLKDWDRKIIEEKDSSASEAIESD